MTLEKALTDYYPEESPIDYYPRESPDRLLPWRKPYRLLPKRKPCQIITLKKALVDPDSVAPYLILVCLAKSSADSIGDSILSTKQVSLGQ